MSGGKRGLVLLASTAVLVAGCGASASADPAKPPGWEVIHLHTEGYSDLITFCDHGNRLYLARVNSGESVAVAANDPTCAR